VTFTASSATAVNYEFFINDVRVQNSASNKYITTSLINGQKASVRVTTASGCSTLSAEIINLVNPKVTVNAGTDQTVCEATQVTLSGSATVEDKPIAVTWSGGAGTFSNVHDLNATYTPAPGETGKTIILTLTTADPDENGPCSEAADQVRITINMLPAVLFSGLNLRYCVDASTTELTGFPAGGTFTGPGISKGASGQDLFTPNLAGVGSHVIRYTYTNANSCTNYFERTVIVHPLPSVSFTGFNKEGAGATSQYAQDAPTISLTGLPAGGAFTGEGISGNTFSASAAGPGTHTIRYTYGDANGCINFQEQIVTVLPLPEVGIGNMPAYFCSRDQDYLLTGTPAGGTFSGPGIIAGTTVFRPSNAFIGSNIIRYTYKDPVSGGTNFIEKTVVVYKVPDVTFSGLNAAYCVDAPATLLNGFPADNDGPGGVLGVFKGEGIYLDETQGNYHFIPSVAGIGTHRITYIFTNENGCTDSTSKQVIVNDLPMVTFNGLDNAYCLDAPSVRLFGFPSGGTFSGPGISSNNFIPSLAGTGTHTISYTFTNSNGCTSIQQQQVVINPVPVASFQYADVCDKNQVMFTDLTATSETGSIQAWEWNFGDPVSGTSNTSTLQNPTHMFTAPGTYNVSLKVISEYGCVNTKSLSVTIGGIPDPDFTWSAICMGEDAIFNHGTSVSVGTITKWHWNFGDNTEKEFNNSIDPVSHQYASAGRYNVTLTVTTNFGCTNSITKEVYILPAVNTYPYFENFENNDGGWIEDGFLSSWQYGTPASNTIKQAASGSQAWITGLTSGYNANEKSFVYSPCFDFSSLRKPMISLNIWNHTQQGFDGVVLQSSVNGGLTWINVGAIGEGINWYNQSAIIGNPGNQQIGQNGWSGTDSVWHNAKYALDHLKGLSSVRFRIAFGSNNDNPPNQILDGFAFDDVYVGERDRTVVLEHFTNAANPEAAEEDNFINHLSQDTDEVISIHYHTNFPGYDPMNADNQADPSARTLFYGIPQTPRTAIDGHTVNQKFSSWGLPVLSKRKLTETAFSIDVDFPQTADQALNIQANIKALLHITDTLTVHIVVVEKQTSNLSGNGIVYKNVLRKMLPNAAGTRFTKIWLPGETQSINQSWQVVNVQDAAQLAVIVFIQNDRTKEIYQATIKQPTILPAVITGIEAQGAETRSFVLYPNPASQQATLAFGQPISQEYAWSVYDMLGRKVDQGIIQKGQHTLLLNTATYVEGSYVIHINGRNKISYHKKLVIIHNK
jgi:PKD repeat protein